MVITDQIHREKGGFAPLPEPLWCLPSSGRCAGKSQIHHDAARTRGCPYEGRNPPCSAGKAPPLAFKSNAAFAGAKTSRFNSRGACQPSELMQYGKHRFCSMAGAARSLTHCRIQEFTTLNSGPRKLWPSVSTNHEENFLLLPSFHRLLRTGTPAKEGRGREMQMRGSQKDFRRTDRLS